MVYLALGILTISISAYIYSYGRPRFSSHSPEHISQGTSKSVSPAHQKLGDSYSQDESALSRDDGSPSRQLELKRAPIESQQATPDTTPKAGLYKRDAEVPSLTLDGANEELPSYCSSQPGATGSRDQLSSRKLPKAVPPCQPSPNPQPLMLPPPRPGGLTFQPSTSSLMPPPSRLEAKREPLKPSTTLAPPPSAASTLRMPPSRSLAPTTSSLPPSSHPSKKVLLAPGHSPLDWANLVNNPPSSTFLRGASVPSHLIRVPPSLLRYHNGRKGRDAWSVWQGKVYNMTPYMDFHPGGVDQLMRGAGKEGAEKLFLEIHPWVNWDNMLGNCLIGILVSHEEEKGDGRMDEMD